MHIRSLTREDLPQLKEITFETFKNDAMYSYLQPKLKDYPDDFRRVAMIRFRTRIVSVGQHGFVAVTDEGDSSWNGRPEVAGVAFVVRYGDDEDAKRWQADPLFKKLERKLLEWHTWYEFTFLDRTTDPVRMKAFSELVSTSIFNELGPRWHLAFIGVSPRHQRQGVGKLLVERGQKLAREEGLPLTLEASVPGRGLYAKLGFKTVGEVRVSEEIRNPMMLWEPEERQGRWLEDIGNGEAKMRVDGKADSRVELVS